MANNFGKEEIIMQESVLEAFEDAQVLSKIFKKHNVDQAVMERTGDVIWRPMSYISSSYDGTDATANFKSSTELLVPATISYEKHATLTLTDLELRNALQERRLGVSKVQKLASDINVAATTVAVMQGTQVIKRTAAASGFDDVAQIDALFNEQGIMHGERYLGLCSRDYNNMASNLAGRQTMTGKPTTAYEKAYVGTISGFETYKLDYADRLTAAAGGGALTINTTNAAGNYHVPVSHRTASTGERSNVDNRYQTVTISSTTNVAAGDCFTIAGCYSVHHITKGNTGQLKTFRVVSVPTSTTLVISPPLISNQVASDSSEQYQNCVLTSKSASAAIVFLNTVTANANPFWHGDAFEILPGRYATPSNAGSMVSRATTESGIEIVTEKFHDMKTKQNLYRWDIRFGIVCLQPEMAGIILFSQT
jgi:hypothetical protein